MAWAHAYPEISDWSAHNLEKLRLKDLQRIADLYKITYSGYTTKDQMIEVLMGQKHIADAVQNNPQEVAAMIEEKQPEPMVKVELLSVDEVNKMKPFEIRAYLAKNGIIMPKTAKKAEMLEAWRQYTNEAA